MIPRRKPAIRQSGQGQGKARARPLPDTVEDELSLVLGAAGSARNQQMMARRYGWDGGGGETLARIGRRYRLTRERVRQIGRQMEVKWQKTNGPTRRLRAAVALVYELAPDRVKSIESALKARGLTRGRIGIDGLIRAAEIAGMELNWSVTRSRGERIVARTGWERLMRGIVRQAKKKLRSNGVTTIARVAASTEWPRGIARDDRLVESVLRSRKDFVMLDPARSCFWLGSVSRNRLVTAIRKIFSVARELSFPDFYRAVRRDTRMRNAVPPIDILSRLCENLPFLTVKGNMLTARSKLDWRAEFGATSEFIMADILRRKGPVLRTPVLQRFCSRAGISGPAFWTCLTFSPVLWKPAQGLYSYVGAKISTHDLKHSAPRKSLVRTFIGCGVTRDRKLWFARRVTWSLPRTGVIQIPVASKGLTPGQYRLEDLDHRPVGELKVRGNVAWGLGPFLRGRKAKVGDSLLIMVDQAQRAAQLALGRDDLIEDLQHLTADSKSRN